MDTLKKRSKRNKKQTRRQADPAPDQTQGRPEEFTPAQVIKAIQDANGLLAGAARILGCSRSTIYNYLDRYEEIRQALDDAGETTTDFVEGKLIEAIRAGNITAIIFYLKTKAKARGYIERTEHTGADGRPLVPAERPNLKDLDDSQLATLEDAAQIVERAFNNKKTS